MNDHSYAQWIVDGLGGLANMMEQLARHPEAKFTAAQLKLIDERLDKLMQAREDASKKVIDG